MFTRRALAKPAGLLAVALGLSGVLFVAGPSFFAPRQAPAEALRLPLPSCPSAPPTAWRMASW